MPAPAPDAKPDNDGKGEGPWQCYGCLLRLPSLPEGFDSRCPECGSYELHLAEPGKALR